MEKTKIDWCDSTWNPVTGCLHGCGYCYAREIAHRFDGGQKLKYGIKTVLHEPVIVDGKKSAYPFGFAPTFHRYRLGDYAEKKGRNIFVCSMADLFGEWVPDNWIEEVLKACEKAPQHNYLFLTKNPQRYAELEAKGILKPRDNMWYGFTNIKTASKALQLPENSKFFASIEPLLEPVRPYLTYWAIIGAETGRRKGKIAPKREWIEQIVADCREYDIPIFMKSSLSEVWGEPFMDIDARELARELLKSHAEGDDAFTCDEDFDRQMVKYLMHGLDDMEGLIAAFYRNIWAMAEIHECLRRYEGLGGKGRLLELPCAAGDMVYGADKHGEIVPMEVIQIGAYSWKNGTAVLITCWDGSNEERVDYTSGDFGKTIFTSRTAKTLPKKVGNDEEGIHGKV